MRYAAMIPDLLTGRLIPFRGEADVPVEFEAADQLEANRIAWALGVPPAAILIPAELREAGHPSPTAGASHAHARDGARRSASTESRFRSARRFHLRRRSKRT